MFDIYNNKNAFLKNRPKKNIILIILFLLIFTILCILTFKIRVYENYQTKGYVTCDDFCTLTTFLPSNITYSEFYVNKNKVNYELLSNELEIDESNYISYRKLIYLCSNDYDDKEIVDINFYYNKQRIIDKIIEKLF